MFKKLFSPVGRLSRGGMWLWMVLIPVILGVSADLLDKSLEMETDKVTFSGALNLFYFWPSIALSVKRFHDLGVSGWIYVFLSAVFYASLFILVVIIFGNNPYVNMGSEALLNVAIHTPSWFGWPAGATAFVIGLTLFWMTLISPGDIGDNRYGPDPLEQR